MRENENRSSVVVIAGSEIGFVTIYALFCGEKFNQKLLFLYVEGKNTRYEPHQMSKKENRGVTEEEELLLS